MRTITIKEQFGKAVAFLRLWKHVEGNPKPYGKEYLFLNSEGLWEESDSKKLSSEYRPAILCFGTHLPISATRDMQIERASLIINLTK